MKNKADTFMYAGLVSLAVQLGVSAYIVALREFLGKWPSLTVLFVVSITTMFLLVRSIWLRHKPCKPYVVGWTLYDKNQVPWEYAHKGEGPEAWSDVEQAIVDEIRKKKYKFGGNYHQYGKSGCPIMNDGTTVMVSMRHWGDIMSRVWGGSYCEYAWTHDEGEGYKVPKAKPGNWNRVRWLTEEEIKQREDEAEEARKQNEAEVAEIRKNREAATKKQHKEDLAYANKFISQFLKRRGVNANADVCLYVAETLVKVFEDSKLPECAGLKWILSPAERVKVRKEKAEKAKKWAEDFRKYLDEQSVTLQP